MLLQALRTRDPNELAEGFPRWDLRARQLGGGPFRGGLEVLQLETIQIVRASGDRRLQTQGALPPGSFGFAPVLPRNDGALWRGRRCQALAGGFHRWDLPPTPHWAASRSRAWPLGSGGFA